MSDPTDERKAISIKTLMVSVIEYEDGTFTLSNENSGFSPIEIVGIGNLLSNQTFMNLKRDILK